jgi:hypothetical protein
MKKTLAALTAVALAAGLSLAAFVAPASATDAPTATPSPAASSAPPSSAPPSTASATPTVTPSATPTESATPTPAPTSSPAVTTTTTPTVTTPVPAPVVADFSVASTTSPYLPLPCVPDSQVTYTYDPTTNSGAITIPNPVGFSGVLCTPFYATAASWTFDTAGSVWKQTIKESNHVNGTPVTIGGTLRNIPIQNAGTYSFGATVGCGQGDIYASFTANAPTLFPETPGHLNGPSDPFTENLLSAMGFSGPAHTYTVTGTNCNTTSTPVIPTVDPITSCGQYGSITIPTAASTPGVVYTYNGTIEPAGTVITHLSGSQTVVATPASGFQFTGPQSVSFTLDLGTYVTCDLTITDPTLAQPVCTGTDAPDNGSITIRSNVFVEYTLTGPGIVGGEVFGTSATDNTPETIDGLAPGQYTVTATGLANHTINGQTVFTFNIITLVNPYCVVVAPVVTSTAPTCGPDPAQDQVDGAGFTVADTEIKGVIHLPVNGDVVYSIDGGPTVAAGDYIESDGTHHVTATLTSTNIANGITIVADPGVYTLSNNATVATWTITFDAGCSVLPAWNAGATATDATCSADSLGTITLSHEQGTQPNDVKYVVTNDATSHVVYSGTDTNDTVLHVAAGHYTVVASPVDPADGISGNAGPFAVTVAAVTAICADDTSLAFTGGTIAWSGFALAGGMLLLGITFLLIRRRGDRAAQ